MVVQFVLCNLCRRYELDHAWFAHAVETVTENEKVKFLKNLTIETYHVIQARRLDIIVQDREMINTWIIELKRMNMKKWRRFRICQKKYEQLWKTSTNVISMLLRALAAVASLDEYKSMLDIVKREVDRVQFSALLESVRILRKVSDISG